MELLIGADPELFVYDKKGRKFVTGYDLIPGTKDKPHPVDKGAVQVDGMALEFNIDPAKNYNEFEHNINTVMGRLKNMIPNNLELKIKPSVMWRKDYLESMPEKAKELGCDPDWNAYTEALNPAPNAKSCLRTAAGHIHLGWTEGQDPTTKEHLAACFDLVKALDAFVGVPSLKFDKDKRRRRLYGKAGAFRPKSYGLEYRVLSNAWLETPERMLFVYMQVHKAFNAVLKYEPRIWSNPAFIIPTYAPNIINGEPPPRGGVGWEEWWWRMMDRSGYHPYCCFSHEVPK